MQALFREHIERITPLTDTEFDYIYGHLKTKKLKKHQFLVQEGDRVINDHFVIKGCLKAYLTDNKGKEHILQFAMEDWWISDYQALIKETPATLTIDCIEDCELLTLSLHNREKLCSEMHKIEHFFRQKLTNGYVGLQQRILSMLNNTAKERYDMLLASNPALFQRVPKQLIASYLGVTRETLSRLAATR
ncbi:Crp/Fnr family transcriptional regulator [Flavihumibacter cheonanensis]|uniref:Crp/Fnr family transcriptional regulator n=1 Tax=Flavihumibacter cheonanensis TaxID=1442385 RepID=UPI001EF7CE6D|nr:Crp/Fnr family transcriptional regulator [Flavihumibacter cheonanensis]MCG7752756.1 Crp/Fnr family transcriptional regulator [Flavihumibacter cheonanensis]